MNAIPPPPGSDTPVPGAEFSDIPPPTGEAHVNDVLDRKKRFSWKSFGGDGFLVSVAFHILLAIIALFYVVSKYAAPKSNAEPEVFVTGSGGGNNGEKPKAYDHPKVTRQVNVKMPVRITSKVASSIALPDAQQSATASFAFGLTSGGMSKGSGGGSGGGEKGAFAAALNGIGGGGAKNFVSLFGSRGIGVAGLPGTFYDIKQTADGKPSRYQGDDAIIRTFDQVVRRYLRSGNEDVLTPYFKAPEPLYASQIMIPNINAGSAPAAFGFPNIPGKRWMVTYKGEVVAPKTGRFRFWGLGDDAMAVKWAGKPVLDAGWVLLTTPANPGGVGQNYGYWRPRAVLGVTDIKNGPAGEKGGPPFRAGPWIDVEKGHRYPIEIILTECYGGLSAFWLMMEEGEPGKLKGDGELFLFRMTDEPLPDGFVDPTTLHPRMDGKGYVWRASAARAAVR